jgi:hypothetical protein
VRTGQPYCEPERIQVRTYPMEAAAGQRVVEAPVFRGNRAGDGGA